MIDRILIFGAAGDLSGRYRLRLAVGPDRIGVDINLNGAGDPFDLEPAELALDLAPQVLPAYARLPVDIFDGDPTLSIRGDEAEEAWRIVEPVLASWQAGEVPLRTVPGRLGRALTAPGGGRVPFGVPSGDGWCSRAQGGGHGQ